MKFKFKIQEYQTDAVKSVVDCFKGQPKCNHNFYRRDIGEGYSKLMNDSGIAYDYDGGEDDTIGVRNESLHISKDDILKNIQNIQSENSIKLSTSLKGDYGVCTFDVEMETGTGKTYVYIKTMYELNKKYGWSKFIVIVPSVAIREGVKKSFEITQEHFMQEYGKKIRFSVYSSDNLQKIDEFSSNSGINVIIMNMQAFNKSLRKKGKNSELIIYTKRDEFNSRRPIDVISATNPILILDEPQKMSGEATKKALKNFNALFTINYSATHKTQHNLVYALDALDAYTKKLVKKIEVKGFSIDNLRGTDGYLYLDDFILSEDQAPRVRMGFEKSVSDSVKRVLRIFSVDDNLYEISGKMEQYKGHIISDINPIYGEVSFTNGKVLHIGDVLGNVSDEYIKRIQIRETIKSHLQKEEELFVKGIKTLSLFFIDEVAKYRQYDEEGTSCLGEYGKIFEEEYNLVVNEYISLFDSPYQKYLKNIDTKDTHKGYFSIDKKSGKYIDGKISKKENTSDDISAYDLILKNKERLLSFDEPTRFIFSHSALREGWDNPNVFQLCTLKQSDSEVAKRQEVGRGLRLCVDQSGTRMDSETLGKSNVHALNKLTVIASESYENFTRSLQDELKSALRDRPRKVSREFFENKVIYANGKKHAITLKEANSVYKYLLKNDYIDENDSVTDKYREEFENNTIAELPEELSEGSSDIHKIIQSTYSEKFLSNMIENANTAKILSNKLNKNFYKKEFQELWKRINHKYAYIVSFDSKELIEKAIKSINENLYVSKLQYVVSVSSQKEDINIDDINEGNIFKSVTKKRQVIGNVFVDNIKYDLLGKISGQTKLTRRTVAEILKNINTVKFVMYKENPEEFIKKVINLINEQKATMIVEHISYNKLDEVYDSSIFTAEKHSTFNKAIEVKKHIQDYIFTDGIAKNSIENKFAKELEEASEVCVYAKLPRGFYIPTPVGKYTPDWAIAFNKGYVKHIFFIAETKGSMKSMDLREIEKAKISCAKKLFNEISTDGVKYHEVDSYRSLLNIITQDNL